MSYTKAKEARVHVEQLGLLSATTTRLCFTAPFAGELVEAEVMDTSTYTGHATNNYTFAVKKGSTTMATLTTTADIAASVASALTVNTTAATRRFAEGDLISVVATKNNAATNTVNTSVAFHYLPVYDHGSES